jgi:hypothetical protein
LTDWKEQWFKMYERCEDLKRENKLLKSYLDDLEYYFEIANEEIDDYKQELERYRELKE